MTKAWNEDEFSLPFISFSHQTNRIINAELQKRGNLRKGKLIKILIIQWYDRNSLHLAPKKKKRIEAFL